MAVYSGSNNDDRYLGTDGRDVLWGKDGNDELYGAAGADTFYGGDGDDILYPDTGYTSDGFTIQRTVTTPSAGDRIDGGAGRDLVDYSYVIVLADGVTLIDLDNKRKGTGAAVGDTFNDVEDVRGSVGDDKIFGGESADNAFLATWGHDAYDGRGGVDRYEAFQNQNALIVDGIAVRYAKLTLTVAYGAAGEALAGPGVTLAPGQGVAYYSGYDDANFNGTFDSDERSFSTFQLLTSVEEISGSFGDDTLNGTEGDDYFDISTGSDKILGGKGTDTLVLENYAALVDLAAGTAGSTTLGSIENLIGSFTSDQIYGSAAANLLIGGDGNDALDGAAGNDRLAGGANDDVLIGGEGDDVLSGGAGTDMIDGGAGTDLVSYASSQTSIAVSLLSGHGLIPIIDGANVGNAESIGDRLTGVENVDGSIHADVIYGNQRGNVLSGLGGEDLIYGCNGNDVIWGERDAARILPALGDPREAHDADCDCGCDDCGDGGGGGLPLPSDVGATDELHGGNGLDMLYGGAGADLLYGGCDSDLLDGGVGLDILNGGEGDDTLAGGAGFDFLFGGEGVDTITYAGSAAGVTVDLSNYWNNAGGDAASDLLTDVLADLLGGGGDVTASSSFLALIAALDSGDDTTAYTLAIPDLTLSVENAVGSAFADVLTGAAGANRLDGGAGDDALAGGIGNDVLVGGTGADTLTGGKGADTFLITSLGDTSRGAALADRIADFTTADGDRIDVSPWMRWPAAPIRRSPSSAPARSAAPRANSGRRWTAVSSSWPVT